MNSTLTTQSGKVLHPQGVMRTTKKEDAEAKAVRIRDAKNRRLQENRVLLQDANVKAFISAIAQAEGGDYDFKFGAVRGRRNDPWRFTDFSTHPGFGQGHKSTAAGMYQVTIDTWREMGGKMDLSDFGPETQDLIAVEIGVVA